MSHNIDKDDQHSWKGFPLTDDLLGVGFNPKKTKMFICQRGDCKCERLSTRHYGHTFNQYSRGMVMHSSIPNCFGDTPINQQTID